MSANASTNKEPWNFNMFRESFDEIATEYGGKPFDNSERSETELSEFYQHTAVATIKDYAAQVYEYLRAVM